MCARGRDHWPALSSSHSMCSAFLHLSMAPGRDISLILIAACGRDQDAPISASSTGRMRQIWLLINGHRDLNVVRKKIAASFVAQTTLEFNQRTGHEGIEIFNSNASKGAGSVLTQGKVTFKVTIGDIDCHGRCIDVL